MQYIKTIGIMLTALTTFAIGCGDTTQDVPETSFEQSKLAGQWHSPDCETGGAPGSEFYYKRAFDLTSKTWAIDFTLYTDNTCATASSTASISGPFEVLTASEQVDNAWLANFTGSTKTLIAFDAGTAGFFESVGCGEGAWTVNEAKDISKTGCAPLGLDPVEECPVEYDLIRLDGDKLFFGDRSNGMCDDAKRTNTLQTVPVVKQ